MLALKPLKAPEIPSVLSIRTNMDSICHFRNCRSRAFRRRIKLLELRGWALAPFPSLAAACTGSTRAPAGNAWSRVFTVSKG